MTKAVLREKLAWYPTINYDLCLTDLGCLNSCPNDVFGWDRESRRPMVLRPINCSPGCDICLQGCRAGAISLPDRFQWRLALRRFRGEPAPSTENLHLIK